MQQVSEAELAKSVEAITTSGLVPIGEKDVHDHLNATNFFAKPGKMMRVDHDEKVANKTAFLEEGAAAAAQRVAPGPHQELQTSTEGDMQQVSEAELAKSVEAITTSGLVPIGEKDVHDHLNATNFFAKPGKMMRVDHDEKVANKTAL